MTPDRLRELRRVAEAATPGPWAWRMSQDGRILDLITLETGYNEEIITPSHINAWLQVKGGLKDFIPTFDPATALALLDEIERLRRVLEQVEWEQSPANCPICDGYKSHGHAPDCELAAALASAPAAPPAAQERPERAFGEEGREGR